MSIWDFNRLLVRLFVELCLVRSNSYVEGFNVDSYWFIPTINKQAMTMCCHGLVILKFHVGHDYEDDKYEKI